MEELHILQWNALAPDNSDTITGQGVGVRGGLVNLAKPTRGKHHRFGVEDMNVASGEFVGDNSRSLLGLLLTLGTWFVDHDEV